MASKVVEILFRHKDRVAAWDTETVGVDLKTQGPSSGRGKAICLSAYLGPDVDFGNGPHLFFDNYQDSEGLINYLKPYFEDPGLKKTWHN